MTIPLVCPASSVLSFPCKTGLAILAASLAPITHSFAASAEATASAATLSIDLNQPGKAISADLFGIFFEDLNYAADGGLYAELIQNRSFEYNATEMPLWNFLTAWEIVTHGDGKATFSADAAYPIHPNNPHYAVLQVSQPGEGVGLLNAGFDGIPIKAGESYDVSLFARHLYTGNRWGPNGGSLLPPPADGKRPPLIARLENSRGEVLGETVLEFPKTEWTQLKATITASGSDDAARFVVLMNFEGGLALDVISLFPKKTFRGRPNGLRADLAQTIADLEPKFMRFPGGCLVHGNGLGNMYRWKDTIGPVEQRRAQSNLWRYHQTVGLGYFEYFQFCEDIGAKPLPVVAAGVCCQNSAFQGGNGQRGLPLEEMGDYIQDVLDLIEYANGPVTSVWGAKRAAAGHPEPFHLKYIGVGNEDAQTEIFRERFKLIHDSVKAKYPEITVIGTVGPFHSGKDFDEGWKFANELNIEMVDEHYYEKPEWFRTNLERYDTYDRARSKVYVGEYAAHDDKRLNTLRSALAEAAFMTGFERNGDVVRMTSYAPLLAKVGHSQWNPDLIYFTNTTINRTTNYNVQQMFGANAGDLYLTSELMDTTSATPAGTERAGLATSAVRDSQSGDLILKLVNTGADARALSVTLSGLKKGAGTAMKTVLKGEPMDVNTFESPSRVTSETSAMEIGETFAYDVPAFSFTVIRIKTR